MVSREELMEAKKFERRYGLKVPTIWQRLFMPKVFWIVRDGAIEILAEEKYIRNLKKGSRKK